MTKKKTNQLAVMDDKPGFDKPCSHVIESYKIIKINKIYSYNYYMIATYLLRLTISKHHYEQA